jgi:phosphate-selective porin OprO/OprP
VESAVIRLTALEQSLQAVPSPNAQSAVISAVTPAFANNGSTGISLRSGDGALILNLRGQVQADGRFGNAQGRANLNTFALGSIRPILEGTVYRDFGFRIMPDFGRGTTFLQEAYFDGKLHRWLRFRAGKYKGPVGLERLAGDSELLFFERAFPTALVPNRDVGLELYGEPWGGAFTFAAGVFDGVPDGSSTDLDADTNKDFEGRVFAHPFRNGGPAPLQGLGIGVAGTYGDKDGTSSVPGVAAYRTSGQQVFFHYRADATPGGTVLGRGGHSRISPQAYFYLGPFGAFGEYVHSSQEVALGALRQRLDNQAWQVAASYVLTGEKASYRSVTPAHPLDVAQGYWGAFELGARYSVLRVDPSAFPVFADPLDSSQAAHAWNVGLNWFLNRNAKLVFNYEQTRFTGILGGERRRTERVFLNRFQIAF